MTGSEGSPYLGLSSYREDDAARFFGREDETRELERLVRRSRVTVLFGRSGLGKSSLLHAGLFPAVRDELFPIVVRMDLADDKKPIFGSLRDDIAEQARLHQVDVELAEPGAGATMQELFRDTYFWSRHHKLLVPLLVIDRFEELFTLGRRRRDGAVQRFVRELAALADPRERTARSEDPDDTATVAPRPLILLALREDFLADLEDLKSELPMIMRSRYRLRPMTGRQAFDAVVKPAGGRMSAAVAEDVVRFVTADSAARTAKLDLADLEVEPALLSMVCDQLYKRRHRGGGEITQTLTRTERNEIIDSFYKDSFHGLPEADKLRELVEDRLVNERGFRTAIDVPRAISQHGVTKDSIEELERRRLVRIERRFDAPHVELIHDLVLRPVIASRAKRQEQRAIEARSRRRSKVAGAIGAVLLLVAIGVSYGAARRSAAEAQEEQRARFRRLLVEQGGEALLRDESPTAVQLLDAARTFVPQDPTPDSVAQIMLGRAVSSLGGVRQSVQHGPEVAWVRLGRDGDRLLTCASDGTARSWALADRAGTPMPIPTFGGGVSSKPPLLIPSHAGDWVLAIGADGSAEKVDARHHVPAPSAQGEEVASTRAGSAWQGCISPDDGGFAIWSPGKPGSLRAWRVEPTGISAITIKATSAPVPIEVVCVDRGSVLALTDHDEILRFQSPDRSMPSLTAASAGLQPGRIEHIAASPDGGVVVATLLDSPRILVWRGSEVKTFIGPVADQISIAGGRLLVTTSQTRAAPGLAIQRTLPNAPVLHVIHAEKPSDLAAPSSRAAEAFASADDDDTVLVTVWDLDRLRLVFSVERRSAQAKLAQGGGTLTIRSNHQIELWDTATWRPLLRRTIEGRAGFQPFDIARDRSGSYVVAIADGPIVRMFESMRGSLTERRVGHAPELFGAWALLSNLRSGSVFSADQTWVAPGRPSSAEDARPSLAVDLTTGTAPQLASTGMSDTDEQTLSTWLGHSGVVVAIGGRICFKPVALASAGRREASCTGTARTPAASLLIAHPTEPKVLVVRNTGSAEWVSFIGTTASSVSLALPAGGAVVAADFTGPQHRLVIARDDGSIAAVDRDGAVNLLLPAIPGITSIRGSATGAIVIAHRGGVEILEPDGAKDHIDTAARDAVLTDQPVPLLWACGDTGCTAWDPKTQVMLGAIQTATPGPRLSSDGRSFTTGLQLLLLPVPPRVANPVLRASAVTAGSLSSAGDVVARNAAGENELATGSTPERLPPSEGALAPPSFGADRTLAVPSGRVVKLGVAGSALQGVWTAASSIAALSWNREGTRFVAVDADFGMAIIDGRSGNVVAQAPDAAPRPSGRLATFSPSGERFAVFAATGDVEVHRTDTDALVGSYPGGNALQRIELAGDSVLGVIDGGFLVWTRPGTPPVRLSGSFDELRLAPDGAHLVARRDGRALIWTLPLDPRAEPRQLAADAFDIDSTGKRLLVSVAHGRSNTETTVHPLDDRLETIENDHWTEARTSAVFAPGGQYVLMPEAHIIHGVQSHEIQLPAPVRAYAFGGDGSYVIVFDAQGRIHYCAFAPGTLMGRFWPGAATLSAGPSAPDGRSSVRVSTPTGEILRIFAGDGSLNSRKLPLPGHQQLRFDSDPDVVWSLADNGIMTRWDVRTGRPRVRQASVVAAALGVDTARVVVASQTFALDLRELGDARDASVKSSPLHTTSTSAIAIAAIEPTARWLVTGRDDGTIEAFDLDSPARAPLGLRKTASGASPSAIAVTVTSDGPTAAIGRRDGTVDLWRLDGREATVQLAGHSGQILSAAFDASGAWLATASSDGTIRVWDPKDGRCITKLAPRADHAAVTLVAFGPGEQPGLLSASEFGDLFVWDLFVPVPSSSELQELLKAWLPLGGGSPRSR
jgi:WD40 repeat protein